MLRCLCFVHHLKTHDPQKICHHHIGLPAHCDWAVYETTWEKMHSVACFFNRSKIVDSFHLPVALVSQKLHNKEPTHPCIAQGQELLSNCEGCLKGSFLTVLFLTLSAMVRPSRVFTCTRKRSSVNNWSCTPEIHQHLC